MSIWHILVKGALVAQKSKRCRLIDEFSAVGPCEREGRKKIVAEVKAGDRLKVGWTSNNHAGGWVRLSLVPEGE